MTMPEQLFNNLQMQAEAAEKVIATNPQFAQLSLRAQDVYDMVNLGPPDEATAVQEALVAELRTVFVPIDEHRFRVGGAEYSTAERETVARHVARLALWGNATVPQSYAESLREEYEPIPFDKVEVTVGHGVDNAAHGHDYQLSVQYDGLHVCGVFDGVSRSERIQTNGKPGRPYVAAETAAFTVASQWTDAHITTKGYYPDTATAVQVMRTAFEQARHAIKASANGGQAVGNAVAIVGIEGYTYAIAGNVGDCRLFIERADQPGWLEPLTREQNQHNQGKRSILTNVFAGTNASIRAKCEPDEFVVVPIEPGDRLIQGSDGIFGESFQPAELASILGQESPQAIADSLLQSSRVVDDKSVNVIAFTQTR